MALTQRELDIAKQIRMEMLNGTPFKDVKKPVSSIKPKRTFSEKVGNFLGIEKLGKRVGSELVKLTPEGKELGRRKEAGQVSEKDYRDIVTGGVSNKEVI